MKIEQLFKKMGIFVSRFLPKTYQGLTPYPEQIQKYRSGFFYVDTDLKSVIKDIRKMDANDPRVKKIHNRTARATTKGGLQLKTVSDNKRLVKEWKVFEQSLGLDKREKLESDAKALFMEGNLYLQWVVSKDNKIIGCARMPAETMVVLVQPNGFFINVKQAYQQIDPTTGSEIATFPLYQMTHIRLSPLNYDDMGSLGRPYLDAGRSIWKKLVMTEEDLVIRRKMRAPLRLSHTLEGAKEAELTKYKKTVEFEQANGINTDYYLNKKGSVQAIQGNANLDQIGDIIHLLDTFFAGAPAPKGLFGYGGDLARDILEKLTADFYDEVDSLQDILAYGYETGFKLHLLLQGIDPDRFDFNVIFAERRTETRNQRADYALKVQALGASKATVFESAGLKVNEEKERLKREAKESDPYPNPNNISPVPDEPAQPNVSVTPGNAPMGESATTITTRS